MGTKSHTGEALPASIIAKRIGLMLFHWATFTSGCVYLSFPGHFLYVSITKKPLTKCRWIQIDAEEIVRLFGSSRCCSSLLVDIEGL